jgi:hypothetical protein
MSLPSSPDAYESLLNESFLVTRAGGPRLELKLVQVTRKFEDDLQRIFYLLFEGPAELLPQGQYRLVHAQLEVDDILLVPSARTKSGYRYAATFNLLKEET